MLTRDLNGLANLDEVVSTCSLLAESCLESAQAHLEKWLYVQYGEPIGAESLTAQRLIVVGMGKLGGGELNVSSDIDLIFVYPEEGETRGPRIISNHEFFGLLGKQLVAALHDITSEGFVFRVDMRLRPYGDSGSLVISFRALDIYFVTQARPWERYAWIKAKALTGIRHNEFDEIVRPFVYRRYLDYAAVDSLRDLHRQVRDDVKRRDRMHDVKLGPGGIREIEFIAQVFQLIRGGREAELQQRSTRAILARLQNLKLLPLEAADELLQAYVFLRKLEHRLQYLNDAQTQELPDSHTDRALVAKAMNYSSYEELLDKLAAHRNKVSYHFDAVFTLTEQDARAHPLAAIWNGKLTLKEALPILSALGYGDAQVALDRLRLLRDSTRYRSLPESSRVRIDALLPAVIETAARYANANQTLERMLDLLEAISRRESYLALLRENPTDLAKNRQGLR